MASVVVALACTPEAPPQDVAGGSVADVPVTTPAADRVRLTTSRDGDSFVGSDGIEYRVGLVNTPELAECGGAAAQARTEELLAGGFVPQPYSRDGNGRVVARIVTEAGDLGVILAREGWADDRYLDEFRHEHPAYAAELDVAFRQARRARAGLHANCWAASTTAPAVTPPPGPGAGPGGHVGEWACHRAYVECLPVLDDLDCADVGHRVALVGGDDPYRLDGNSLTATNGVGCDTYPEWAAGASYPYYSMAG